MASRTKKQENQRLEGYFSDEKNLDYPTQDFVYSSNLNDIKAKSSPSTDMELAQLMVDCLDESIHENGDRIQFLASAFAKAVQLIELGTTLLSEEELTSPPKVTWKQRDKSLNLNPVEHCEQQFADRIDRGLTRPHVVLADPSLGNAIKRWLLDPKNDLPEGWLGDSSKFFIQENFIDYLQSVKNNREDTLRRYRTQAL